MPACRYIKVSWRYYSSSFSLYSFKNFLIKHLSLLFTPMKSINSLNLGAIFYAHFPTHCSNYYKIFIKNMQNVDPKTNGSFKDYKQLVSEAK